MEIIVLGAGPGGYEAALYAAKRGHAVTLVEKSRLGGTCLNRGCIPTKALIAASDTLHAIQTASDFGITIDGQVSASFEKAVERKGSVVNGLVGGIGFMMKAMHVNVVQGYGRLCGDNQVSVTHDDGTTQILTADKIILATGSKATIPPIFPYNGKNIITSDEALSLEKAPSSVVIVGGGVIGCEIGQFWARYGVSVTIIEMQEHLLPTEDPDVARILTRSFQKEGITVKLGTGVKQIQPEDDHVVLHMTDGTTLTAEKVLVSVGRGPVTADIGLETVGIQTDRRGYIPVDHAMRTSAPNIYAIGDIAATPPLAHVASKEGFAAVDDISGIYAEMSYKAVPRCYYTSPEIAAVGITEQSAKEQNVSFRKGTFDFAFSGKAKTSGKTDGFVKVLTDENDVLIGASIVGAHATDMLQVLTLAVELGLTSSQLDRAIFPHPTMSEAIMEALHDLHKMSVNKL